VEATLPYHYQPEPQRTDYCTRMAPAHRPLLTRTGYITTQTPASGCDLRTRKLPNYAGTVHGKTTTNVSCQNERHQSIKRARAVDRAAFPRPSCALNFGCVGQLEPSAL